MAQNFIQLGEGFFVAPQIMPDDVAAAKALGVALIINNRPDNEEPGQPEGADIEAAARAAGIAYLAIPISGMGIGPEHLDAFDEAISRADGPVLAFCRSGTRSTVLRAYTRARAGEAVDRIIDEAADAGYNIAGQRRALEALGAA
jgi:uncharacterized protein (TIGR01244 family)